MKKTLSILGLFVLTIFLCLLLTEILNAPWRYNPHTGKLDYYEVGGAPTDVQYVVLALNGTLSAERVLMGTANQIILTDGGANGNLTLSTPQDIGTTSDPTFNDLTIDRILANERITFDAEYNNGNSGAAATIDFDNGQFQKITLTANCAFTFDPPSSGVMTVSLRVIQDGTGGWTITWPVAFAPGGSVSLTTTAGTVSYVIIKYDGAAYYVMAADDFKLIT